jgi:hypothetical protein
MLLIELCAYAQRLPEPAARLTEVSGGGCVFAGLGRQERVLERLRGAAGQPKFRECAHALVKHR